MQNKEISLWTISVLALLFSVLSLVRPQGLLSHAANVRFGMTSNQTGTMHLNSLVPVDNNGVMAPAYESVDGNPCADKLQAWQEAYEGYQYYLSLPTTQADTVQEWGASVNALADDYFSCKSKFQSQARPQT